MKVYNNYSKIAFLPFRNEAKATSKRFGGRYSMLRHRIYTRQARCASK